VPERRGEWIVLIVAGEYRVDPERSEDFLRWREPVVRNSRTERGCIEFVFSLDPLEPGRILLFERWESQDALDEHLSALRSRPPETGPAVPFVHREVVRYDVSASAPL
jgi:quinol monooxygenase YgiN